MCFASSSFLLWLGQKTKRGQERLRWLVYGLALLIPITLAGIRDTSIGADVLGYGYGVFKTAYTAPNMESLIRQWDRIEIGYLWINFAVSRIASNLNAVLFLLMFIEILFVFFALYKWRDKFPIWIGMFVFYTFYFNMSLNLLRQCLAMSIAFFGMKYIFERKFFRFAFFVFLGTLFHNSAIITLLYYPLFKFTNIFTSKISKISFAVIPMLLIAYSDVIIMPIADGLLNAMGYPSYSGFYLGFAEREEAPYKNFVFFSFITILFLYKRKTILERFPNIGHFLEFMFIFSATVQLAYFVGGMGMQRIVLYATWWIFILIPIVFYAYRKIVGFNFVIISYCLFYWHHIYTKEHDTIPYLSIFGRWF